MMSIPSSQLRKHEKWNLPPANYLKLNVNGAFFFFYNNKARIEMVLRDEQGQTQLAACMVKERDFLA